MLQMFSHRLSLLRPPAALDEVTVSGAVFVCGTRRGRGKLGQGPTIHR